MFSWDKVAEDLLVYLYGEGFSFTHIAQSINKTRRVTEPKVTRNGVAGKVFRLGLCARRKEKKLTKRQIVKIKKAKIKRARIK